MSTYDLTGDRFELRRLRLCDKASSQGITKRNANMRMRIGLNLFITAFFIDYGANIQLFFCPTNNYILFFATSIGNLFPCQDNVLIYNVIFYGMDRRRTPYCMPPVPIFNAVVQRLPRCCCCCLRIASCCAFCAASSRAMNPDFFCGLALAASIFFSSFFSSTNRRKRYV